ncbi:MAG TPA: Ig-like domain-containing protein [Polyangia bacterium]|nr:Ig-like domain-containing protein [Polyangia bacterium]
MIDVLVRSLGRLVLRRSLTLAVVALVAATTLAACGRSGLRSLGESPDGSVVGNDGGAGAAGGQAGIGMDAAAGGVAGSTDGGRIPVALAVTPPTLTLPVGGMGSFAATLTFSDGTTTDATNAATWTPDDPTIATVIAGRVVALRSGLTGLTVKVGTLTAGAKIDVLTSITLQSLTLDPPMVTLPIGAVATFTVTGNYSDGTTADVSSMATWSIDATGVATVDGKGDVTAEKAGQATLVATVGALQARAPVTVSAATVTGLSVLPPVGTTGIGTTVGFTATAFLSDGTSADVTSAAAWSVDDPMVATIDGNGVATGVGVGMANVTATFGTVGAGATIVVTGAALTTLQIDPVDPNVGVGVMLTFRATGIYSDGTKVDLTSEVTWQSSAPNVVPIDGMGNAVSKQVGTSVITATDGVLVAESTVSVTSASLQSLAITPGSATASVGGTAAFQAIGTFSDGTMIDLTDSVTWSATPTGIVSISNAAGTAGTATALKVGVAAIVATSGTVAAKAVITVSAATLEVISIVPSTASVPVGATTTLAAQGTFSDGSMRDITTEVTWASSDGSIATVANAPGTPGLVTGVKAGMVVVTATEAGVTGMASVGVVAATLQSIDVEPANATLTAGLRASYTATGLYSDGSKIDLTAQATWSTDNTTVATISNVAGAAGQLLARAMGTTNVSATLGPIVGTTGLTVAGATPSSLSISPIAASTPLGTGVQYTATLIFTNGTSRNVTGMATWSSSDTTVATIGRTGRATPTGVGPTTIGASYMGLTSSTTLTVTNAVVTSIELTPIAPTMPVGTTTQFAATAILSDGTTSNVTAMATFSSNDPGVVGISTARMNHGRATAVQAGSADITATYMGFTDSTTVIVSDAAIVTISVSPSGLTLPVGTRRQFTAQAIRSDGTSMAITGMATWTSDTPAVAAVSTAGATRGQVTALSAGGPVNITATYMGLSGSVAVNVSAATIVSVQVTPFNPTITVGTPLQFVATAIYSDGTNAAVTGMATWASDTMSVAQVSNAAGSRGLATPLTKGTAMISATFMTVTGSTTLSVTDATITQIQVTPFNPTIPVGFDAQLAATAIYSDGSNRDITSLATWSSGGAGAAAVSDALATKGRVTGLAAGGATIQAQYTGVSGTTNVNVSSAALVSISIAPQAPTIAVGTIQAFTATGTFNDMSTLDITPVVTWTSSDTSIADVSNADGTRGQATAFGPGTTTIQAQRGAITGTATLTAQ